MLLLSTEIKLAMKFLTLSKIDCDLQTKRQVRSGYMFIMVIAGFGAAVNDATSRRSSVDWG